MIQDKSKYLEQDCYIHYWVIGYDTGDDHMVGWLWAKKATISRGNPDPPVEQDVSYTKMFSIVCSFWNCRHKLA